MMTDTEKTALAFVEAAPADWAKMSDELCAQERVIAAAVAAQLLRIAQRAAAAGVYLDTINGFAGNGNHSHENAARLGNAAYHGVRTKIFGRRELRRHHNKPIVIPDYI